MKSIWSPLWARWLCVFWWSRNCWGQQKSGREEQDSEQQWGKGGGNKRIERGRKKCHENEHWSKRSHWKIVRTKLISQKVMSPPAQTHQGVWIKSQPGSRVGRGGLGSVGGGCNPSCSHPGQSCGSVATALQTKAVPYAEPSESHYSDAAFR